MSLATDSSSTTEVDIDHLRTWEGRSETAADTISPALVAAFRATFDAEPGAPEPGDVAPLGIHWCLALPKAPQSSLGPDGHPARGGFVPPVPLPRRMWAGGRIRFTDALRVGDAISRTSRIASVASKDGRTGPLVFVVVEHAIETPRGPALVEEHDIVFRDLDRSGEAGPVAASPSPAPAAFSRSLEPSAALLFRYSALTFNGHRIHYDRTYTTQVEGYPGLIVHGPLQATLLMQLGQEILGTVGSFSFRAQKPLFDLAPFRVEGDRHDAGATLRVVDTTGQVTMTASAGPP